MSEALAVTAPCQTYAVGVRTLCEFTAKQGDLDLRFTPSPSAQQGIAGHQRVASGLGASCETEVPLQGSYRELIVRGRADGFDPGASRLYEVKTFRGRFDAIPANHRHLHWAQAKIYGALLCAERELPAIEIVLVYYNIDDRCEHALSEHHGAAELEQFWRAQCARFLAWAHQERVHRAARDATCGALTFPHADFRGGQRQLAEAVYKAAVTGRCLLAQAPTGIGKTLGTLFPLLKACGPQSLDKIFFLTAKTPGRQLALDALRALGCAQPASRIRIVELVARDKACEHPDKACHGASCPLAQGFYDRLPAARQAAVDAGCMDRAALRAVALTHRICPYYLGQELARWADVVIGDYNYYFDLSGFLYGMTVANDWRIAVLVDEAHNLVERGRGMYSATFDSTRLRQARRNAPAALKRCLAEVARQWRTVTGGQLTPYEELSQPPAAFLTALQRASSRIADHLAEPADSPDEALLQFYFDMLAFLQVAEHWDRTYLCDLTRRDAEPGKPAQVPRGQLCLRNVVPGPLLAPRFAAARATVLFSATLSPPHYYRQLLGLPDTTVRLDVDSPFAPEQLRVRVAEGVSTRFRDRATSIQPIVSIIAEQYALQPGNYLVFASSFDYLHAIADLLRERCPGIRLWKQTARMDEAARAAFVANFVDDGQGIGLAVLGGAFAEGIDLPGQRLVGAFVATLGLPQLNPVNERIRQRLHALFGDGYRYAYLYPGLQKVVQAAGRIVRSETDRGVLCLLDDRFGRAEVRDLLPPWWEWEAAEPMVAPA